ncbi:acyltransferase [Bifidobacterium sp. ESL0764]|uniref:acyltransferase n=1 Tax=Bifidobacterium sp. ESL0764 TaxID=2983228 RepID=UPI0023F7B9CD|nr:acyltransferase [Bifidobacterium sp. ESL0764]WEV65988.1 acyltransferase [Bifidobacterium sp. ESL0764]
MTTKQHQRPRIIGLDIIKSLAIFLVVLIHYCYYTNFIAFTPANEFGILIAAIGVPLFFMVNGYLLLHARFDFGKHKHRIVQTLVVLLVWEIVSLPIISWLNNRTPISWKNVPGYLLGTPWTDSPLGYFWFMNALIAIYLVFPMLKQAYDSQKGRHYLGWLTVILIILTLVANDGNNLVDAIGFYTHTTIAEPFGYLVDFNIFGKYSFALIYFLLGGFVEDISAFLTKITGKRHWLANLALVVVFILGWLMALCLWLYQRANKISLGFGLTNGYMTFSTLFMTVSLFILLMEIKTLPKVLTKLITIAGANTLSTYYLHMMLILIILKIIRKSGIATPMILNLLIVIVIFAIGTLAGYALRRIPIIGILFGRRLPSKRQKTKNQRISKPTDRQRKPSGFISDAGRK